MNYPESLIKIRFQDPSLTDDGSGNGTQESILRGAPGDAGNDGSSLFWEIPLWRLINSPMGSLIFPQERVPWADLEEDMVPFPLWKVVSETWSREERWIPATLLSATWRIFPLRSLDFSVWQGKVLSSPDPLYGPNNQQHYLKRDADDPILKILAGLTPTLASFPSCSNNRWYLLMVYYMASLRAVSAFIHWVLRTTQWGRYDFSFLFYDGLCWGGPLCPRGTVHSVVYVLDTPSGHIGQNPHALHTGPNTVGHRSPQ